MFPNPRSQGRHLFPAPPCFCCLFLLCCALPCATALPLEPMPWETPACRHTGPSGPQFSASPCALPWQRQRHHPGAALLQPEVQTLSFGFDAWQFFIIGWSLLCRTLSFSIMQLAAWGYPHRLCHDQPILQLGWLLLLGLAGTAWDWSHTFLVARERRRRREARTPRAKAKKRGRAIRDRRPPRNFRVCQLFAARRCGARRCKLVRGFSLFAGAVGATKDSALWFTEPRLGGYAGPHKAADPSGTSE